jgi:hypothetical protein
LRKSDPSGAKTAGRTLMKLNPGVDFINIFSDTFFSPKNVITKKAARKIEMKLTPA